jgi:hypothetical protein
MWCAMHVQALTGREDAGKEQHPPSRAKQPQRQQSPRHSPTVRALYKEDRSQQGSPVSRRSRGPGQDRALWQQRFEEEMQHTLAGHERPGVVSRFPHSLTDMLEMGQELLVGLTPLGSSYYLRAVYWHPRHDEHAQPPRSVSWDTGASFPAVQRILVPPLHCQARHGRGMDVLLRGCHCPGCLQGELNSEVERELASYGISPKAQRMTDAQFRAAMQELEARREEARANMSSQDRQRMEYMRDTITTHVDQVPQCPAAACLHWTSCLLRPWPGPPPPGVRFELAP